MFLRNAGIPNTTAQRNISEDLLTYLLHGAESS